MNSLKIANRFVQKDNFFFFQSRKKLYNEYNYTIKCAVKERVCKLK